MHGNIKIFDLGCNTFAQTRNIITKFISDGNTVTEVHTFEAQKNLMLENLERLKQDYPHIMFHHNNVAVWNQDTTLMFYESKTWGKNYKGGSTLIKHSGPNPNKMLEYSEGVSVPAINFIDYFEQHTCADDYNFIKMDIEGAEYIVLPDLLESSSINNLSELACEYHAHKYKNDGARLKKFTKIHNQITNILKHKPIKLTDWF